MHKEIQRLKMENDILKQAALIMIIWANRKKYSVSGLCEILQIARSTFYYEAQIPRCEEQETTAIVDLFRKNRNA